MKVAMELYLCESAKAGETIPEATTTKVDLDEFDPEHETKRYSVEWLEVSLPRSTPEAAKMQVA
jgi:hypothetical protein